ncbi:MAG: aspartate--tRNA ligase, partial [Victivallaceae bacterium]|nr:aspartate--tRNA ligase [Victivallaceae bacterium]
MSEYRTHTCGELRKCDVGKEVRVSGWIHSVRDHGGVIFIDLRDHYGLTQVVIDPESPFYQDLEHWRVETVVRFDGKVLARSESTVNPKLATGEIEIKATAMEVLGEADVLPFQIAKDDCAPESLRLKYRFLDLRREKLHRNIMLRSQVIAEMRRYMTGHGFNEFQTPILTASSPEGARDYLVPSRLHPGKFYALPQAPQQFKQLLMVAGFDRYFQIAPCFRDEDARADRSPGEFYQMDVEMSFVDQDEIFAVIEGLLDDVFGKFAGREYTKPPFPRIPYREAMDRFGSDKPDLRNPIEMTDVTDLFDGCGFKAFAGVVAGGGLVKAIRAPKVAGKPRKFFDDMIGYAQENGAKGMAYIIWNGAEVKSPIVKFLSPEIVQSLHDRGGVEDGDALFFLADAPKAVRRLGGAVIPELGRRLELIDPKIFKFCWIVDFPMYE